MTDFPREDPADTAMDEPRIQALADMFDAQDMMEKGGVLSALLRKGFDEAKEALERLVYVETQDTEVRNLQWQVQRYDDLVTWTRQIVLEGRETAQEHDADTLEILRAIVRGENDDIDE